MATPNSFGLNQPTLSEVEYNTTPVPSAELFILAKNKSTELTPNSQIRLTAHKNSWYLYNIAGTIYIGREVGEQICRFFQREELNYNDASGKTLAYLQPLLKK